MFLLQLVSIESQARSSIPGDTSLMAVARSSSVELLQTLFTSHLNFDLEGNLSTYVSTLADGTTPCIKTFKAGSPLEGYEPPPDIRESIIFIGTLEARIADLTAKITAQVTSDWENILVNVVPVETEAEVALLKTVMVHVPHSQNNTEGDFK